MPQFFIFFSLFYFIYVVVVIVFHFFLLLFNIRKEFTGTCMVWLLDLCCSFATLLLFFSLFFCYIHMLYQVYVLTFGWVTTARMWDETKNLFASNEYKCLVDLLTVKWNIWPRAVDLDLLSRMKTMMMRKKEQENFCCCSLFTSFFLYRVSRIAFSISISWACIMSSAFNSIWYGKGANLFKFMFCFIRQDFNSFRILSVCTAHHFYMFITYISFSTVTHLCQML